MTRALLSLLLLAACGKSTLTGSTDAPPTLTPSGALAIYPGSYGAVLPWHVETAEASWQHVAPCVGVGVGAVSRFPVFLAAGPVNCPGVGQMAGCMVPERIEIIGVSHDFDPRQPDANPASRDEIARLWRHELTHLALHLRDGDLDAAHGPQ